MQSEMRFAHEIRLRRVIFALSGKLWVGFARTRLKQRIYYMANHKLGRTTEDIRRELSAIFRELKDPRVNSCFLSIVRVEVTNDLSYCTVYVSALEGLDRAKEAIKGLRSASGFIRRELGHRLRLRHVPELIFTPTDSIEYSAEISRILNSLDIKDDEEEDSDEQDNA